MQVPVALAATLPKYPEATATLFPGDIVITAYVAPRPPVGFDALGAADECYSPSVIEFAAAQGELDRFIQ